MDQAELASFGTAFKRCLVRDLDSQDPWRETLVEWVSQAASVLPEEDAKSFLRRFTESGLNGALNGIPSFQALSKELRHFLTSSSESLRLISSAFGEADSGLVSHILIYKGVDRSVSRSLQVLEDRVKAAAPSGDRDADLALLPAFRKWALAQVTSIWGLLLDETNSFVLPDMRKAISDSVKRSFPGYPQEAVTAIAGEMLLGLVSEQRKPLLSAFPRRPEITALPLKIQERWRECLALAGTDSPAYDRFRSRFPLDLPSLRAEVGASERESGVGPR